MSGWLRYCVLWIIILDFMNENSSEKAKNTVSYKPTSKSLHLVCETS